VRVAQIFDCLCKKARIQRRDLNSLEQPNLCAKQLEVRVCAEIIV